MKFRQDINGLRAIAVISVMVFHFMPTTLPGGFVGVDIFFVISGYLMTGIIVTKLDNNNFSLLQFYLARANRIIPALLALSIALLIFGWFYLIPQDYRLLGKHIAASLGFISNVAYWEEAGYFDVASHNKWLLHTWSLSVEWQFYMLYPVLLIALSRLMPVHQLGKAIVVLAGTSLLVSALSSQSGGTTSYFLLHTRAWELLLGGLAYLYPWNPKPSYGRLFEISGIALIVAGILLLNANNPWPGYLALIPVLGTFLIIQAQRHNSGLTVNTLFTPLGRWSYSIYLWHWPLVVAGFYFEAPPYWPLIGLPLSVLLGFISYRLVESRRKLFQAKHLLQVFKLTPTWLVLASASAGVGLHYTHGASFHYSEKVKMAAAEARNRHSFGCSIRENDPDPLKPCFIGNKENVAAIIVGDSHADVLTSAVTTLIDLNTQGVITLTRASCPFIINARDRINSAACFRENPQRMAFIQKNYPGVPVISAARLAAYVYGENDPDRTQVEEMPRIYFNKPYDQASSEFLQEFEKNTRDTICQLSRTNPVILSKPVPEQGRDIPRLMVKQFSIRDELAEEFALSRRTYEERNRSLNKIIDEVASTCQARVMDPTEVLCDDQRCISNIDGRPIYLDGDHLSEFGNKLLIPLIKQLLPATQELQTAAIPRIAHDKHGPAHCDQQTPACLADSPSDRSAR